MSRSQTGLIVFYLLAAFVIFITLRGELPLYLAIFFGKAEPAEPAPATEEKQTENKSDGKDDTADKIKTALEIAQIAAMVA